MRAEETSERHARTHALGCSPVSLVGSVRRDCLKSRLASRPPSSSWDLHQHFTLHVHSVHLLKVNAGSTQ
eukprot:4850502-Prymnesium_polylepis.1